MNAEKDALAALLSAARAFVGAHYPGRFPRSLKMTRDDGQKVRLPVGPCPCGPEQRPGPKLSEMERDIVEAVGDATMTGEQIAEASGYPDNSGLRAALASLRRRGVLTGRRGEPGYSVANP